MGATGGAAGMVGAIVGAMVGAIVGAMVVIDGAADIVGVAIMLPATGGAGGAMKCPAAHSRPLRVPGRLGEEADQVARVIDAVDGGRAAAPSGR